MTLSKIANRRSSTINDFTVLRTRRASDYYVRDFVTNIINKAYQIQVSKQIPVRNGYGLERRTCSCFAALETVLTRRLVEAGMAANAFTAAMDIDLIMTSGAKQIRRMIRNCSQHNRCNTELRALVR